jgi:excisionase family DNA binding protein
MHLRLANHPLRAAQKNLELGFGLAVPPSVIGSFGPTDGDRTNMADTNDQQPICYTVSGATAATGLPRSTIFALIKDDKIETRKVGRRRLILARSLRSFIEEAA